MQLLTTRRLTVAALGAVFAGTSVGAAQATAPGVVSVRCLPVT
ncbi:hypothetical protein ACFYV5_01465 [Streptomyces sp. NPDC003035]